MKRTLLLVLFASAAFAQPAKWQTQIDSLTVLIRDAQADTLAAHTAVLIAADPVLKADGVKVLAYEPRFAKIDLRSLTKEQQLNCFYALVEAKLPFAKAEDAGVIILRTADGDNNNWLKQALPVISAALKDTL